MSKEKLSLEQSLVIGSQNECTTDPGDKTKPLVVRGVIKKDRVNACIANNRDYYYIDTGYLGNFPSEGNPGGKKKWHRVVKNENQHTKLREVPEDRWENLIKQDSRLKWSGWKDYDKKILLVMPNPKACKYYDVDYDNWVAKTKEDIAKYSDLPVEVRVKGSRSDRNNSYSIYDALDTGVFATVAFNSIAAVESILYGIPAFVSVPCSASILASNDLSMLSNPYKPNEDLIYKQACNLAYGQFSLEEILNGTAWKLTNEYSI